MKKITIIASLLILFSACQKADIHPNTRVSEDFTPEAKNLLIETPDGGNTSNDNSIGSGSNPTVDPNNPEGGDITDPLRKKDQKDNK
jgi:hypothetical protein